MALPDTRNGSVHSGPNLWTDTNGDQYAVWITSTSGVRVAKRSAGTTSWQTVDITGTAATALGLPVEVNEHASFAIAVDSLGYIHTMGNMPPQNVALHYIRSVTPRDITVWQDANALFLDPKTDLAYPNFWRFSNGELGCFVRDSDGPNNADGYLRALLPGASSWTNRGQLSFGKLTNVTDRGGMYVQFVVGTNDRLHCQFWWICYDNPTDDRVPRHHSYIYSDDRGVTWQAINGTQMTLPITEASMLVAPNRDALTAFDISVASNVVVRQAGILELPDGRPTMIMQRGLGFHWITFDPQAEPPPPPPSPDVKTLLGAYEQDETRLQSYETWLGRPINVVNVHLVTNQGWGVWESTPANWNQSTAFADKRLSVLTEMWPRTLGIDFNQVIAGTHDAHYRTLAQNLINAGHADAILVIGHEMNGNGWYEHTAVGTLGGVDKKALYIQAYQRIVNQIRSVANGQFLFEWTPNSGVTDLADLTQVYPGDNFVDVVGFDQYDIHPTYGPPGGESANQPANWAELRWTEMLTHGSSPSGNQGLTWLAQFADDHNKFLSFQEWGLVRQSASFPLYGDDNPYFIEKMVEFVAAHPRFLYFAYHDQDNSSVGGMDHSMQWAGVSRDWCPNSIASFLALLGA